MKTSLLITNIILTLFLTSCSSQRFLPLAEDVGQNPFGAYIEVNLDNSGIAKGELLGIDTVQNTMTLLAWPKNSPRKPITFPLKQIRGYKVQYAKTPNYSWTIPVYAASTISHGFLLIFTMPLNLVTTIIVSVNGKRNFTYSNKNVDLQQLKMFARYPGGIPPNVVLSKL